MTSRDFCLWCQGFFEIRDAEIKDSDIHVWQGLSEDQVKVVRNHLNLVFKHEIDPSIEGNPQELQDIHDGISIGQQPSNLPPGVLIRC